MRGGFFVKTAWNNIRKNYRFFVPRILSEIGLLGCFFIALTLATDKRLEEVKGGYYLPTFMTLGAVVLGLLSVILMLYVNSFLMRQRKREFGLYNVLGMEKKHVARIMFHENFICGVVSVLGGLMLGMLFYKLCSILICRFLKTSIVIGFYYIKLSNLIPAGGFFILIDVLTFLFNLQSIARMKPVELLVSGQVGEKEPRVRTVLLLIGIATLGTGYYLAISVKTPPQAIVYLVPAVLLVIVGTYCLFITGTRFVLKLLKADKRIYYHKNRMPAISGLLYRMKQNAVGLASIAILATGVLVMLSTTVSLYSGIQTTLQEMYPEQMYVMAGYSIGEGEASRELPADSVEMTAFIHQAAEQTGIPIETLTFQEYLTGTYTRNGNSFTSRDDAGLSVSEIASMKELLQLNFLTEDTFCSLGGEALGLQGQETAVYCIAGSRNLMKNTVSINGYSCQITRELKEFPLRFKESAYYGAGYALVVSSQEVLEELLEAQRVVGGEETLEITRRIALTFSDLDKAEELWPRFEIEFAEMYESEVQKKPGFSGYWWYMDNYWDARESCIGMYGTLLFLGILLGTVCMFSTVLIIYYKQISEGYEDRERFRIMEKIGMSRREVRRTINTQVLIVFFLPLVTAACHVAAAYPMLKKLLLMLMLPSGKLFMIFTLVSFAVFALVYVMIYAGTSRTYYKIVH